MNRLFKIIIYIVIGCNILSAQIKTYKLSESDKNKINQAKALEKIGQFNEAEYIYIDILSKSPYIKQACIPLKNIYMNKNKSKEFIEYANNLGGFNLSSDLDKQEFYHMLYF